MAGGVESPPPPYDALVEYIATDGSQYINLGRKGDASTDALYVDFQATTAVNQARLIAPNQANAPCQMYINGSNKYGYRVGTTWGAPPVDEAAGTDRHTWMCDYYNQVNIIDNVDYAMSSSSTGTANSNLLLTGPYTTNAKFKGKIYAAKVFRSGVLVLDLVPCRVDTTAYMYDTISRTLFGNVGTGSFTYGNDLNT